MRRPVAGLGHFELIDQSLKYSRDIGSVTISYHTDGGLFRAPSDCQSAEQLRT